MNTVIYFKPTWSTQSIHLVLEARGDHGYFHYTVLFSTDTAFRGICRHSFNTLYQLGVFTVDAIKRLTAFSDIYFKCMSSISSNLNKIVPRASTPLGKAPATIFLYLTFIENVPLFIKIYSNSGPHWSLDRSHYQFATEKDSRLWRYT